MEVAKRMIEFAVQSTDDIHSNEVFRSIKILEFRSEKSRSFMRFSIKVPDLFVNAQGEVNRGAIGAYIDNLTGILIYAVDIPASPLMSVNISIDFYAPIPKGSVVEAITEIEKSGKFVKFLKIYFYAGGTLAATGTHLLTSKPPKL